MITPHYTDDTVTLHHGDVLAVLRSDELGYDYELGYGTRRAFPDASVDAVVTDPPYGIAFMGKAWDQPGEFGSTSRKGGGPNLRRGEQDAALEAGRYDLSPSAMRNFQRWCEAWAAECLRILKPGGHLVAFGGARTWHRLAGGVEDAGFEIRDSIAWLYGSGFPKSLDVSKAIDRAAGVEREREEPQRRVRQSDSIHDSGFGADGWAPQVRDAVTDDAKAWQGWGTALKPAFEPIVVGRKPLAGTVAANVLAHSTGALNIDATRVAFASSADEHESKAKNRHADFGTVAGGNEVYGDFSMVERTNYDATGRWPTNVVLDGELAEDLDAQSGAGFSRSARPRGAVAGAGWGMTATGAEYDDAGGASRFFPVFRYEAKAPTSERPRVGGVAHPTVKPLDLMRWLVRLVTPSGGVVLEPFAGSGTTAEACVVEGFRCIAIEREADYLPLITSRLTKPIPLALDLEVTA